MYCRSRISWAGAEDRQRDDRLMEMYLFVVAVYFIISQSASFVVRHRKPHQPSTVRTAPHDRGQKCQQMVRAQLPGAERLHDECREGRSGRGLRSLGLRQVHADQMRQRSGAVPEGNITVDGVSVNDPKTDLPKLRARVGMVFQHFELFPHMTIVDNLWLAQRKVLGRSTRRRGEGREAARPRRPDGTCGEISRPTCPAASSSASRLPAHWRWTRSRCCSTSRPRRSIPR